MKKTIIALSLIAAVSAAHATNARARIASTSMRAKPIATTGRRTTPRPLPLKAAPVAAPAAERIGQQWR